MLFAVDLRAGCASLVHLGLVVTWASGPLPGGEGCPPPLFLKKGGKWGRSSPFSPLPHGTPPCECRTTECHFGSEPGEHKPSVRRSNAGGIVSSGCALLTVTVLCFSCFLHNKPHSDLRPVRIARCLLFCFKDSPSSAIYCCV